jgi:hypothetical protein
MRNAESFLPVDVVKIHTDSREGMLTIGTRFTLQRIDQGALFLASLFPVSLNLRFQTSIPSAAMFQDHGTAMLRGFVSSQAFLSFRAFLPTLQILSSVLPLFWRELLRWHMPIFYHGVPTNAF